LNKGHDDGVPSSGIPPRESSFLGKALDSDMDREMRAHLDLLVEEYERTGMSPEKPGAQLPAVSAICSELRNEAVTSEAPEFLKTAPRCPECHAKSAPNSRLYGHCRVDAGNRNRSHTALFSVIDRLLLRPLPYPRASSS